MVRTTLLQLMCWANIVAQEHGKIGTLDDLWISHINWKAILICFGGILCSAFGPNFQEQQKLVFFFSFFLEAVRFYFLPGSTTTNQTYHFHNGFWSQGVDLPEPRKRMASVSVSDSEVMACGGKNTSNDYVSTCWIYDHVQGMYSSITSMKTAKNSNSLGMTYNSDGIK